MDKNAPYLAVANAGMLQPSSDEADNKPGMHQRGETRTGTSINDFEFIAPEGWQVQNNADHLLIRNPQSGCAIRILSHAGTGGLEQLAAAVFDLMYAGWQYQSQGERQYILTKGILSSGLEFFMKEGTMYATGAAGSFHLEEGAALVIKYGQQIAIVSIRHQSSLLGHDACWKNYNTMSRFLNSFSIKNTKTAPPEQDAASRIIGTWKNAGGITAIDLLFAANGHYQYLGGWGSITKTTDYHYDYIHTLASTFEGDGSYSVAGNHLKIKKHGSSNEETMLFRFAEANHGGTGWKDRMYLLKKDAAGETEVCYEKAG